MSPVTEKTTIAPFGIEISHPRNCDVSIKSIPGSPLRGAVNPSVEIITNAKQGDGDDVDGMFVNTRAAHDLGLPRIPGQQLHLRPDNRKYTITDPLHDNESLCEAISRAMSLSDKSPYRVGKIKGLPPRSGELDNDQFKSLVREVVQIVEAGEGKVVKGSLPKMEDVDALPGDYLLNPGVGRMGPWNQPRYEKDLEEWKSHLSRMGG